MQKQRKRKRESEREIEIMVCMIIFVTTEDNQLSGCISGDDFDCIIPGKDESNQEWVLHDMLYLISWSPCLSSYHDVDEGTGK